MVLTVCLRDTFSIFAQSPTVFPPSLTTFWSDAETLPAALLGQGLTSRNPVRNGVALYLHAAGIEVGYGFFAPNVPNSYKLAFEISYPDGHREYDLPRVGEAGTGFRLESLLDRIADTTYQPLREMMFKMLAYSVWQEHPDATVVRAVFGYVIWPSPEEFERGKRESFELLYAYDFTFSPSQPNSPNP